VEVEGCSIPNMPIDGGSGVNLMLEETAFDLGVTTFEAMEQVLRMADQSKVNPVGKLSQVPTRIGGKDYLLNYVIKSVFIKVDPFQCYSRDPGYILPGYLWIGEPRNWW